ncbi:uncharacterized protein LOC103512652 [Diaphorina citri]|uniref:Uncharacterized protein LOC103512652 n=1 Tax=Diaphorina citri TaxID=121845 RepID=A0A1S4EFL3_DIACI|nr:uncharacterized protein LOC103512652 [Diaphorina citri]
MTTISDNRIFFIQIMIDSVNMYNSYKYDSDYGKLKVFISKFLHYPAIDISTTPFKRNDEEGTTDVKVNEGKTFMFSIATNKIESVLKTAFVDFQVLLESDNEDKVKAGIHNLVVGYTRIQVGNELTHIINAVDTVKSDNPVIKDMEGAYVIRQGNEQVGTIFLGIRFTMFGNSLATSIGPGTEITIIPSQPQMLNTREIPDTNKEAYNISQCSTRPVSQQLKQQQEDFLNKETKLEKERDQPKNLQQMETQSNVKPLTGSERNLQQTGKQDPVKNIEQNKLQPELMSKKDQLQNSQIMEKLQQKQPNLQQSKGQSQKAQQPNLQQTKSQQQQGIIYHRKPDDTKDFKKEYTYIYSELNGQVIDMKIAYEPRVCNPQDMKDNACR